MNRSSFLIGGTASGSGKTTITLGLMAAFKARGLRVQPFKCGPDFIDPSLHRMVTGEISSNLDLRMCGRTFCRDIFSKRCLGQDLAVVEGVMGLFDGGVASSASLAKTMELPVILVIDARSAAESVAAVLKGFECYDADVHIAGVIFNRVGSSRHRDLIERGVVGHCQSKVLGFFPRDIRFEIPDRHLGLHMGDEQPLNKEQIGQLVDAVEEHIDLDALLQVSRCTTAVPQPSVSSQAYQVIDKDRVSLAVARDQAFCFYYEDNLDMLKAAGIDPVFFSPLSDSHLPPDCKGVYLGGGYPELFADQLSSNATMLSHIKRFAAEGGTIVGECGGFMYLCKDIETLEGRSRSMTGIFPLHIRMKPRFSRLGYRRPHLLHDCFFGSKGVELHGHEFHYSEILKTGELGRGIYRLPDGRIEGQYHRNVLGSYIHLHFARSQEATQTFYRHLKRSEVMTSLKKSDRQPNP